MPERIWYLKRCDLFRRLSDDELHALERHCRSRTFPRGAPIYLPIDQADGVLLLVEGRVRISSYTDEGKQTILAFIEPGELFGELALIAPASRDEFAEAVVRSTVVLIPRTALEALIERNPSVALGVTRLFGLRRQRIERRLKYLLFRSNRERLVHLLLELAEQYGQPTADGGVELAVKLSHQDLASIIGSTRETVTVVLGELQQEGLVRIGRQKVTLTAPTRLAAEINAAPPAATRPPRAADPRGEAPSEKTGRP
jgi:CRP-like cAMP-binding protein